MMLRTVLYNETNGLLATSEIRTLSEAVPDYGMFHTNQQTSSNPEDLPDTIRTTISFLVKAKQSVDQWIQHHAEGPANYYRVACYAPYVYGIATMLLIAIFPFAGYAALLPGQWKAILTWAKYLLWVKLWLVFWAVLSAFNWWRYSIEDLGYDPSNGIGDASYIFPAIAVMYLVTPGLALVVVQPFQPSAARSRTRSAARSPGDVWSMGSKGSPGGGAGAPGEAGGGAEGAAAVPPA
jgi:hypothetical protein